MIIPYRYRYSKHTEKPINFFLISSTLEHYVSTILRCVKLNMFRIFKYMVPAWLFLLAAGCAQLPDYAKPQFRLPNHKTDSPEYGFTYRQLKVDDFHALSLPENFIVHAKNLNARVCTRIRLTRDSKFIVNPVYFRGKKSYFASSQDIAFEAVMIPSCSWWNLQIPEEKKVYALQHEQIHFALTEIAARRLTLEAREVASSLLVIQTTQKGARDEISLKIGALVQAAMDESMREHTAFDEDTSLYFDPKKQRRWLERVEEQLRKTAPEKGIEPDT